MIFNNIWEYAQDSSYKVSLGKYGKEFYESGQTGNNQKNCNDMRPSVLKDGVVIDSVRGGFDDIFRLMESCLSKPNSKDLLVAFATLFYRNALLIDHRIDNIDNKHYYIYEPPRQLLDLICSSISSYEGIPMEVYIHFLDAIGFNEDVKYFTQGKLQKKTGIGRENNMKTYTHDACCLLGHTSWADFIYKLIRSYGVSPISNQEMASFSLNWVLNAMSVGEESGQQHRRQYPLPKLSTNTYRANTTTTQHNSFYFNRRQISAPILVTIPHTRAFPIRNALFVSF